MASWQSKMAKLMFRWRRLRGQGTLGVDVAAERKRFEAPLKRLKPAEGVSFTAVEAGGRPALWIEPPDIRREGAILYFHGGVYLIGSIQGHLPLTSAIAAAAGMQVLPLDYRLAPEHPFPAAVEDARAAYEWLLEQGLESQQVIVAGDSAGGGLALALLLALREAGRPLPAAAVCLSPWTDLTGSGASRTSMAKRDYVLEPADLQRSAALYLDGADARSPLASPLFGDLRGLPPMLIQVGSDEILLDDATGLAESARAAGVDVSLEVWDDMFHVWQMVASFVPEGQQAIKSIGRFIDALHQADLKDEG